jgi:AbrB family looped-hinge helix DNA binding protein
MLMQTVITSKFQTTIPKKIREKLKLLVNDSLEWRVESGKIILEPLHKGFLLRKNSIKTGPGNIDEDIALARRIRAGQES